MHEVWKHRYSALTINNTSWVRDHDCSLLHLPTCHLKAFDIPQNASRHSAEQMYKYNQREALPFTRSIADSVKGIEAYDTAQTTRTTVGQFCNSEWYCVQLQGMYIYFGYKSLLNFREVHCKRNGNTSRQRYVPWNIMINEVDRSTCEPIVPILHSQDRVQCANVNQD